MNNSSEIKNSVCFACKISKFLHWNLISDDLEEMEFFFNHGMGRLICCESCKMILSMVNYQKKNAIFQSVYTLLFQKDFFKRNIGRNTFKVNIKLRIN